MIHRFRYLGTSLLLLASTAAFAADTPHPATNSHAGAVSMAFSSPGSILARRSHQTIDVSTLNVDKIDISIHHIGEGDTLKVLEMGHDAPLPLSAQLVLEKSLPATDGKGAPAKPGQPGTTSIDILHLLPSLQSGLYFITVKPQPFGNPATMWLMISNLGIEAFTGSDGIAAQVRLLSETNAAPGVDVALIARNNRELARGRTDADGVVRFGMDVTSGKGEDAPAALYAYGADGEFTAMLLDKPGLLFPPPHNLTAPSPRTWIVTDRSDYKPGEVIHGLSLTRDAAGGKLKQTQIVQLLDTNGVLVEEAPVKEDDAGLATFGLPVPDLHDAHLTIRLMGNEQPITGSTQIGIDTTPAAADAKPANVPATGTASAIVISPGRRTFQPGEMANVSVQPPADADVTLAVVDESIHAIIHQHIGKDGGVVQLPIPAEAMGGVYVLATAFTPADEATGKPVQRLFGLQWLDIDAGAKRMGVRLDAPETAPAGKDAAVKVTLPDLSQKTGAFAIIGTDGSVPSGIDPIGYFFGRRPVFIGLHDDYADVIGGASQPVLPDIASLMALPHAVPQPALLWTPPHPAGATPVSISLPMPQDDKDRPLRLSVVAASPDKIGFSETGITVKGEKPSKEAIHPSVARAHATTIKPNGTLTLKPGQAVMVSAMPILAPPVWVGPGGETDATLPQDEMAPLENMQADRDSPADQLYDMFVADRLGISGPAEQDRVNQIRALAFSQTLAPDEQYFAFFCLYGHDLPLAVQDWLASAPKPSTTLGWLSRYGMTRDDVDAASIPAPPRNDDNENQIPVRQHILQILAAQVIGGPAQKVNTAADIAALARSVQDFNALDPRTKLGLRALQRTAEPGSGPAILPEWADAPKVTGLAGNNLARAGTKPITLDSKDKRTLHALILSNWPDKASQ